MVQDFRLCIIEFDLEKLIGLLDIIVLLLDGYYDSLHV